MIKGTTNTASAREAFLCLRWAGAERMFVAAQDNLKMATQCDGFWALTEIRADIENEGHGWVDIDDTNSLIYHHDGENIPISKWDIEKDKPPDFPSSPEWHEWGRPPLHHFREIGEGQHPSSKFVFFHQDEVLSLNHHRGYAWKEGIDWDTTFSQNLMDFGAYIQKKTKGRVKVGKTSSCHMMKIGGYLIGQENPETPEYREHSTDYIDGKPNFELMKKEGGISAPIRVMMDQKEVYKSTFNFEDTINRIIETPWRLRVWEGNRPLFIDDHKQRLLWAPTRGGMHA